MMADDQKKKKSHTFSKSWKRRSDFGVKSCIKRAIAVGMPTNLDSSSCVKRAIAVGMPTNLDSSSCVKRAIAVGMPTNLDSRSC